VAFYLLSRNIRMEADLVDHLFNSSEKRLARLLLLLANFGQESKPIPVVAKISQETSSASCTPAVDLQPNRLYTGDRRL
jgi:hypothetical protein